MQTHRRFHNTIMSTIWDGLGGVSNLRHCECGTRSVGVGLLVVNSPTARQCTSAPRAQPLATACWSAWSVVRHRRCTRRHPLVRGTTEVRTTSASRWSDGESHCRETRTCEARHVLHDFGGRRSRRSGRRGKSNVSEMAGTAPPSRREL